MGLLFHTSSHQIHSVLRLWCCYCLFFCRRSLQCWFFHVVPILGSPRGLFWLPKWKLPLSHALCLLFCSYLSIQSCLVYSYFLLGCVTWTAHQIVNTMMHSIFKSLFQFYNIFYCCRHVRSLKGAPNSMGSITWQACHTIYFSSYSASGRAALNPGQTLLSEDSIKKLFSS